MGIFSITFQTFSLLFCFPIYKKWNVFLGGKLSSRAQQNPAEPCRTQQNPETWVLSSFPRLQTAMVTEWKRAEQQVGVFFPAPDSCRDQTNLTELMVSVLFQICRGTCDLLKPVTYASQWAERGGVHLPWCVCVWGGVSHWTVVLAALCWILSVCFSLGNLLLCMQLLSTHFYTKTPLAPCPPPHIPFNMLNLFTAEKVRRWARFLSSLCRGEPEVDWFSVYNLHLATKDLVLKTTFWDVSACSVGGGGP